MLRRTQPATEIDHTGSGLIMSPLFKGSVIAVAILAIVFTVTKMALSIEVKRKSVSTGQTSDFSETSSPYQLGYSPLRRSPTDKSVKLFMITKNEWPIVKSWVLFHGDMFGFNNLYVYDGSDDVRVVDFLNKSTKLGTHVVFTKANLNELTELYNGDMKKVLKDSHLLIKMDTDELLFGWDPTFRQAIVDPYKIQQYINSMVVDGRKISVSYSMYNYVNSSTCHLEDNIMHTSTKFLSGWPVEGLVRKVLIPAISYEFIDLGGHVGRVKAPFNNSDLVASNFALAHYHFPCFAKLIILNNQAVYSHGYVTEKEPREEQIAKLTNLTQGYPTGPCKVVSCHKAYQMLQWLRDPVSFQRSYENNLEIRMKKEIPEFSVLRDKLMLLEKYYAPILY